MSKACKVKNMASGGVVKKAVGGTMPMPKGAMSEKDMKMMDSGKKFRKGGMARGR